MKWHGPVLDGDKQEILELMNDLHERLAVLDERSPEGPGEGRDLMVETGLWVVGAPEASGGGGADLHSALLVLERLGRVQPALGWASAQAQAALCLVNGDPFLAQLATDVAEGRTSVAVLEFEASHVQMEMAGGLLSGQIDRIDVGRAEAGIFLLQADGNALYLSADQLEFSPVESTGLDGSLTQRVACEHAQPAIVETSLAEARAFLRLGAAAVAAGLAGMAADTALEYAASREQFGGPLTRIPVVRQSLFEQVSDAARALTTTMSVNPASLVGVTAALENSMRTAIEVAGKALQSHGGYGYLDEYPTVRYLRDAVSLQAASDAFGASVHAAREYAGMQHEILKGTK